MQSGVLHGDPLGIISIIITAPVLVWLKFTPLSKEAKPLEKFILSIFLRTTENVVATIEYSPANSDFNNPEIRIIQKASKSSKAYIAIGKIASENHSQSILLAKLHPLISHHRNVLAKLHF
jgi:hypothetical protein